MPVSTRSLAILGIILATATPSSTGMITPDADSGSITELTASEIMESPQFDSVRSVWAADGSLLEQVDYQIDYRAQADYLQMNVAELANLLSVRPQNGGYQSLGLYLWDTEVQEMQRRAELGDKIDSVENLFALGDGQGEEGSEPNFADDFAGIWQDQLDGGKIVIAVTAVDAVDMSSIASLIGDSSSFRIIEQDYSYNELNGLRDVLVGEVSSQGLDASVLVTTGAIGRTIEIRSLEPEAIAARLEGVAPSDAYSIVEAAPFTELGLPQTQHSFTDQQPGLAIAVGSGSGTAGESCTWGFNGHTGSYSYVVSAGHCASATYDTFTGWIYGDGLFEISQTYSTSSPWPRIITPGDTYLVSKNGLYDMLRAESTYANDNCYHGSGSGTGAHCQWPMANRASHNSWEIGSDQTCASLGKSNTYRCGYILEENFEGGRTVRADIDNIGGDSGSGAKWDYTIDGIIVEGSGTEVLFQTSYDVETQLGFDFNCASPGPHYLLPSEWDPCPVVDR